ncbi:MAG: hypothetical protein Fur0041_08230 [Bacteroidia bacterium]
MWPENTRFARFRDKMQVFFLGFLLGIVLGGGFFVLKLDQYVKELALYKSLTEKNQDYENVTPDALQENNAVEPKKTRKKVTKAVNDSLVINENPSGDSTLPSVFEGGDEDNIVVKKDQLIATRSIAVVMLSQDKNNDSLIRTEAGIKDESGKQLTFEFWKSPLNYKGYKMSRSRVVLFGFGNEDVSGVVRFNGSTYLKTTAGVFRLENSSELRQLERVTDEGLIAKLQ